MQTVIYARISSDRDGAGVGVTRQIDACRQLAADRGWTVGAEYVDNDISATDRRKRRPEYEAMATAYGRGEFRILLCWDLDRLTRQPRQLEDWIDAAEQSGLILVTANGEADLSTDGGRMYARIKAAVARAEVERKSARQKAAALARAKKGLLHVAGRKSFGYQEDGITPDPVEAAAIVTAAQALLDGMSLRAIARQWDRAGLTTARDHQWTGELVSQLLVNPRLAGIRTYHREQLIFDGEPVRGEWTPILDDDTWTTLHAFLTAPARRWPAGTSQLLLSGVAVCGRCGGRINSGGVRQGNAKAGHRYRCVVNASHINRTGQPVDEYVTDALILRLSEPDAADHLVAEDVQVDLADIRRRSSEIRQRLDGLAEAYADGTIDRAQLQTGTARLRAQLATVEAGAATSRRSSTVRKLAAAGNVRTMWDGLGRDVQRSVIDELMTIRLYGPGAGIRYVSDEHVKIVWK